MDLLQASLSLVRNSTENAKTEKKNKEKGKRREGEVMI